MTFFQICPVSEISHHKLKIYVIDGVKILVVKSDDNKIWVFDSTCTHADKSLENGKWDSKNALLTCPFHRAVFDISQHGRAVSPPAVVSLKVYSTQIQIINSTPTLMVDLDS